MVTVATSVVEKESLVNALHVASIRVVHPTSVPSKIQSALQKRKCFVLIFLLANAVPYATRRKILHSICCQKAVVKRVATVVF